MDKNNQSPAVIYPTSPVESTTIIADPVALAEYTVPLPPTIAVHP